MTELEPMDKDPEMEPPTALWLLEIVTVALVREIWAPRARVATVPVTDQSVASL